VSIPRRSDINDYRIDAEAGVIYGARGRPVGSIDSTGYLQIDARSRDLGMLSAHRLIWENAHGPIPADREINHKNGRKADNRIANLELITHQGNILHAYRTGLKSNAGEKHPSHVLSAAQVREIRRRYVPWSQGATSSIVLAAEFGVSRGSLIAAATGRTWKAAA